MVVLKLYLLVISLENPKRLRAIAQMKQTDVLWSFLGGWNLGLKKQRHVSRGQFQKPIFGISLLKEEEAHAAVLLRKKTFENKSVARMEDAAISMHPYIHLLASFPKTPSVQFRQWEIKKNAVDYLPSLIPCGQERWAAIGKDSKVSFTVWNCSTHSLERHRRSVYNSPHFTVGKGWISSYVSFFCFFSLKPFQSA